MKRLALAAVLFIVAAGVLTFAIIAFWLTMPGAP